MKGGFIIKKLMIILLALLIVLSTNSAVFAKARNNKVRHYCKRKITLSIKKSLQKIAPQSTTG